MSQLSDDVASNGDDPPSRDSLYALAPRCGGEHADGGQQKCLRMYGPRNRFPCCPGKTTGGADRNGRPEYPRSNWSTRHRVARPATMSPCGPLFVGDPHSAASCRPLVEGHSVVAAGGTTVLGSMRSSRASSRPASNSPQRSAVTL